MGNGRNLSNVENRNLWVSDGLGKEELGVWLYRLLPLVLVVLVLDEGDLDTKLGERVLEEVVGSAIERGGRDDVVASLGNV